MSEQRQRLFVAADLPGAARAALAAWRDVVVAAGGDALRPVGDEALHVTLCFLGWREADSATEIARVVTAAARPAGPVATREALWLPKRRPRVLAVSLEDRAGTLAALQAVLSQELAAAGHYVPEERPFMPHVTVARVRARARAPRDGAAQPPQVTFIPTAVTLYRSHLSPAGARYEPLAAVPLGDAE